MRVRILTVDRDDIFVVESLVLSVGRLSSAGMGNHHTHDLFYLDARLPLTEYGERRSGLPSRSSDSLSFSHTGNTKI